MQGARSSRDHGRDRSIDVRVVGSGGGYLLCGRLVVRSLLAYPFAGIFFSIFFVFSVFSLFLLCRLLVIFFLLTTLTQGWTFAPLLNGKHLRMLRHERILLPLGS